MSDNHMQWLIHSPSYVGHETSTGTTDFTLRRSSGCLDDVNDAVNPEQELFDDNTFVNEDQHIKLTWTIESASTIRINLEKQDGPNIDLYTMTN